MCDSHLALYASALFTVCAVLATFTGPGFLRREQIPSIRFSPIEPNISGQDGSWAERCAWPLGSVRRTAGLVVQLLAFLAAGCSAQTWEVKLVVALQLEGPHRFIKEIARGLEDPPA
jgi:hypothetical protein